VTRPSLLFNRFRMVREVVGSHCDTLHSRTMVVSRSDGGKRVKGHVTARHLTSSNLQVFNYVRGYIRQLAYALICSRPSITTPPNITS
jgi:hypothetical protein